jgi:hypothetical protein
VCTYPSYEERGQHGQSMSGGSRDRRANRRSSSSNQVRTQAQSASTHHLSAAPSSSTSSTFFATPISPPLPPSAKRSLSDLDDGMQSPVATLHSTKRHIFTARSIAPEDPSDLLTAGLYDDGSGPFYDFMGVPSEFESAMPNPLPNWQQTDRHARDAWSTPSRAADPFTPLMESTSPPTAERWDRNPHQQRPSLHNNRRPLVMLPQQHRSQHQQRHGWPSMEGSQDPTLDILIGDEPRMFTDLPSPTTTAMPNLTPQTPPWPSPSRSKASAASSGRNTMHDENHMHMHHNIENGGARLFQLYSSLAQWSGPPSATANTPVPSVADAHQHTSTLISILHSSLSYHHHHTPSDRAGSPNDMGASVNQQAHGQMSSRETASPDDRAYATPFSLESHHQDDDTLSGKDPTIVFLILACAYRLLRLYQRIVEDVDASMRRAILANGTRSCCRTPLPASPASTPETGGSSTGGDATEQPSAVEWIQTVSATLHLADKMNKAVRLLATTSNRGSGSSSSSSRPSGPGRTNSAPLGRGFRPSNTPQQHDEYAEYAAYDGEDGDSDREGRGELDGVVAEPMKQISLVTAKLWRSIRTVISTIRASNLL